MEDFKISSKLHITYHECAKGHKCKQPYLITLTGKKARTIKLFKCPTKTYDLKMFKHVMSSYMSSVIDMLTEQIRAIDPKADPQFKAKVYYCAFPCEKHKGCEYPSQPIPFGMDGFLTEAT
jgi:acyl-ACP thioesterase